MPRNSQTLSHSTIARDLLAQLDRLGASDLHLVAGRPAHYRVEGKLVSHGPEVPVGAVRAFLSQVIDADVSASLLEREEIDLSGRYEIAPGREIRFRLNVALSERTPYVTVRRLLEIDKEPEELGLPGAFLDLCREHSHGVIFVTGTTGSGKSTTLASVLAWLLKERPLRVITLEDPMEYGIPPGRGVVTQREIGQDTKSFAAALRAAMRQDPDVILVGEVRDSETAEALLTAAETGHLVFATLHVGAATLVSNRIAGMFSSEGAGTAAVERLHGILAGVLTQALVPSPDGASRHLAWELLVVGNRERDLLRASDWTALRKVMREQRRRMADSLVRLTAAKKCLESTARGFLNYQDEWDAEYLELRRREKNSSSWEEELLLFD